MKSHLIRAALTFLVLSTIACGDSSSIDELPGSTSHASIDCNGIAGGSATLDECGDCIGGSTGLPPCDKDEPTTSPPVAPPNNSGPTPSLEPRGGCNPTVASTISCRFSDACNDYVSASEQTNYSYAMETSAQTDCVPFLGSGCLRENVIGICMAYCDSSTVRTFFYSSHPEPCERWRETCQGVWWGDCITVLPL